MGNARQDITDFDELYKQAQESQALYEKELNNFLSELKEKYPGKLDGVSFEQGPLKDAPRAIAKINADYNGNAAQIADLVRGRFITQNAEQINILRNELIAGNTPFAVEAFKDQFAEPTGSHFRAINSKIRLPNGHVSELRIEDETMEKAAKKTHELYRQIQAIERQAEAEGRDLTPEEVSERNQLNQQTREIHDEAAKQAGLDPLLNENGKRKVADFRTQNASVHPDEIHRRNGNGETLGTITERAGATIAESGIPVVEAAKIAAEKIGKAAAAIVPVMGIGAGAASAATNAAQGHWGDAAMDAAGMIPVVGDAVDLAQMGMAVGEFVQSVGGPTPEQARFNAIYNAIPPPNDNMDPELRRMAELKAQIITAQTAFEEARLGPMMITENGSPDMLAMNNRRIATETALETAQDAFAMQYDAYQAAGKFGPPLQPSTRNADIAQDTSHDAKPDTAPAAPTATMTSASADIDAQIRGLSAALAGITVTDRPAPFMENEGQATYRAPQSQTRTV